MSVVKNIFSGLLLVLVSIHIKEVSGATVNAISPVTTSPAWTAYVGSLYTPRSWAQSVRDVGGVGAVGFDYADPVGSLATFNETLAMNIAPQILQYDLVLSVGGLGSGRDQAAVSNFMSSVKSDSANTYRDALYQRAKAVALLNGGVDKAYWQFGNEINTEKFSETLHGWAGDGVVPIASDTTTIPWLVEYFLAPGAEGVRLASEELFADASRIHIMLGSIAVASNLNSQAFLNALLDYRIVGTYSPTLAGKYVYEIVDTLSIHYVVGPPGSEWRDFLDGLHQNRIGKGSVRGVVSTEEVGQAAANLGYGMSKAVQVLTRYMDWWLTHNISPNNGRVFFYGNNLGPVGTSIDDLMPTLHGFLGDVPLTRAVTSVAVTGATNIEHYQFESDPERRRILSVFSADGLATTLNTLTLDASGWNQVAVTGHHYKNTGDHIITPSVTQQPDGKYLLNFGALTLGPRESLLLFLEDDSVNVAPVVDAIDNQFVAAGGILQFDVRCTDNNLNDRLTLTASALPYGATFTPQPLDSSIGDFFWAPDVTQNNQIYSGTSFRCTDNGSPSQWDEKVVALTVGNASPLASASVEVSVNEGSVVTLAGSGTDPEGDAISYAWVQTGYGGLPPAMLTNEKTASATFVAPDVTVNSVLEFMLTVTDSYGAISTAITTVTVKNIAPDMVVSAVSSSATKVQRGRTFTFTAYTKNQGNAVTSLSTNTGLYLSNGANKIYLNTLTIAANLSVNGTSSVISKKVTVPATLAPGTYSLYAIADEKLAQTELDEGNNSFTGGTITVTQK